MEELVVRKIVPETVGLTTTVDPSQIQKPSQIPPLGSRHTGLSRQKLIDVYHGTLQGDTDAQPAAKELLGAAPDTAGISNADYVYGQVSAVFGGKVLPPFKSPSGNDVVSIVFVSGSEQGGYGAFHFPGTQIEFDRIVVDSLNAQANYSADSGLSSMGIVSLRTPHLFPIYRGLDDLLSVVHTSDSRLERAKPDRLKDVLSAATRSSEALRAAMEARDPTKAPNQIFPDIKHLSTKSELDESEQLIHLNRTNLSLIAEIARVSGGRQYLSTALFTAEIVESFQKLTRKADPGKTDGEALSRVLAYKITPEIALVPGFNSAVTQQWWKDGAHDYANDNSQNDQSTDGNGAGVMFLEFLNDYLGVPMDTILAHMPETSGAKLGQTYANLLNDNPDLESVAGPDGPSAFNKMVSLLQGAEGPDGSLNLPANGNPFPGMLGSKQGGLLSKHPPAQGSVAQVSQDAQAALSLEVQMDQQLSALKSAIAQIQTDLSANLVPVSKTARATSTAKMPIEEIVRYGPPLITSLLGSLDQRAAPYRAPQYDQVLQSDFWPNVYNELPGTGPRTDRLQVITGTNQSPVAVEVTGTIKQTKPEKDGDLHISFQPDDPKFPTNQDPQESPLEIEVIYAGPVSQPDAKQAQVGYTNPFDISQLVPGTRILAAGPLIFDTAHGRPTTDGTNVDFGLEIHPLSGVSILGAANPQPPAKPAQPPAQPVSQISTDIDGALSQATALSQTAASLTTVLQKMKQEAPTN